MVHNLFEYVEKRLSFADFMEQQGVLIERCNEAIAVWNTMKAVGKKYDGKKRILKKIIAEVQEKIGADIKIEVTKSVRATYDYQPRIYVTTKTCNLGSNDVRIKYDVLFTVWVDMLLDADGRLVFDSLDIIADHEISKAKAQQAKAKEECAKFNEWDKALEDAVKTFYDKIEDIPDFFLDIEGRCIGEFRLR